MTLREAMFLVTELLCYEKRVSYHRLRVLRSLAATGVSAGNVSTEVETSSARAAGVNPHQALSKRRVSTNSRCPRTSAAV